MFQTEPNEHQSSNDKIGIFLTIQTLVTLLTITLILDPPPTLFMETSLRTLLVPIAKLLKQRSNILNNKS